MSRGLGRRFIEKGIMRGVGYDTVWIGEYWIRHFVFDSLEDYLAYLMKAETHEAFLRGAQASEAGSEEFTLTESLDEAIELCRFGWHDGFNDLVALVEKVKRNLDIKIDPNRTFHDYVGFAPDVKAYLEGSPLTMINKPVVHKPLVTIYMNTSYAGNEPRERIYARGGIVLAAAEALELMGFMVDSGSQPDADPVIPDNMRVYYLSGFLSFSNIDHELEDVREGIVEGVDTVILELSGVTNLDATASETLRRFIRALGSQGVSVRIVRSLSLANDHYTRFELRRVMKRVHAYPTVQSAIDDANRMKRKQMLDIPLDQDEEDEEGPADDPPVDSSQTEA